MADDCPLPPCKPAADTTALKKRIVNASMSAAYPAVAGAQSDQQETVFGKTPGATQSHLQAMLDTLAKARKNARN